MKKHFKLLLTITSFVSVLGSLCSCGKSEANVSDNAFKDTDGVSLTKARSITRDFSPSSERVNDAIVHTTVNSATTKKYIRYAFPVDCVDIEHLSITRTIDSDSKKVTINTVYKKIAYEGKEYFYNPSVNGMLSETDPGNGFYFACYCIEVSSSSLNKNIAANVEADYELGAPIVGATTKTSYSVISNGVSNQATVRFFDLRNKEIEKQIIAKDSTVTAPELSDITCWLSNGNVWSSGSTVSSDLDITAHKCKELHLSPAKEATCTGTGYKEHYRCAICQTCYEDSAGTRRIDNLATWKTNAGKINPLGHNFDFANKVVTWNDDVATATAHCINPNCSESVTETKQGSYVRDTIGSCTVHERGHYAVTFNDTRLGNAATEANSIDRGIVHNFGDLIPQVDAHRETAGTKAHYHCSSCDGYFDADHNPISASSLVIPAPARHFAANTDMNFDFDAPIPLTETITVDVKLINPTASSKVNFALFGLKDGGGSDWNNYFGYFGVRKGGVDSYTGVSLETVTDDGYFRIKIDLSQVDRVNNTNGGTPSFSAINGLYVRGGWTDVEGSIEINSTVAPHHFGDLITQVDPVHDTDGMAAHYECSECGALLDEDRNPCSASDLKIPNNSKAWVDGDYIALPKTYTNQFIIDIKFSGSGTFKATFYAASWGTRTDYVTVNTDGTSDQPAWVSSALIDYGWIRLTLNPLTVNRWFDYNPEGDARYQAKDQFSNFWINGATGSGLYEVESKAIDHEYGELILGTPETHTSDGLLSHYHCSVCNGYFDENKNRISSPIINTKHSFAHSTRVDFRAERNTVVTLDIKFTTGSTVWLYFFDKDAGDPYRYIGFKITSSGGVDYENNANFTKPTDETTILTDIQSDGWVKVFVDLSKLTEGASVSGVNFLRTHASWGDGEGTIMVNSKIYTPLTMANWKLQRILPVEIKSGNSIRVRCSFTGTTEGNVHLCLSTTGKADAGKITGFGNYKIINKGNGTVQLGSAFTGVSLERVEDYVYDVIFDLGAVNEHGGGATSAPATGDKINAITIYNWLGTTGTICYIPD